MVKNLPGNAGDTGNASSIPGSRRSSGGGQGNPLQYSCLEDLMDRGAWRATLRGVTELDMTRLLSMHAGQERGQEAPEEAESLALHLPGH